MSAAPSPARLRALPESIEDAFLHVLRDERARGRSTPPTAGPAIQHSFGNDAVQCAFRGEEGALGVAMTAEWALELTGLRGPDATSNQARLTRMATLQGSSQAPFESPAAVHSSPVSRDGDRTAALGVAHRALDLIADCHGRRLPADVARRLGAVLGVEIGHARIHTDSQAHKAARMLGARAFALGHDVFFSSGTYQPGTRAGDELLAHELTHVVQHDEGRLPGGPAGEVSVSRPSDAHETEAVDVARQAVEALHGG